MSGYTGIREQRRDTVTFTDWDGDSVEGAEQFRARCLRRADRSFSQGLQCQQTNSIMALLSMEVGGSS